MPSSEPRRKISAAGSGYRRSHSEVMRLRGGCSSKASLMVGGDCASRTTSRMLPHLRDAAKAPLLRMRASG
jgi:hypothetical protein